MYAREGCGVFPPEGLGRKELSPLGQGEKLQSNKTGFMIASAPTDWLINSLPEMLTAKVTTKRKMFRSDPMTQKGVVYISKARMWEEESNRTNNGTLTGELGRDGGEKGQGSRKKKRTNECSNRARRCDRSITLQTTHHRIVLVFFLVVYSPLHLHTYWSGSS